MHQVQRNSAHHQHLLHKHKFFYGHSNPIRTADLRTGQGLHQGSDHCPQRRGIASTVQATRQATPGQLLAQSLPRLQRLMNEGVTTLEIKSGYGLALEPERKMLQVARTLGQTHAVDVCLTTPATPASVELGRWVPTAMSPALGPKNCVCWNTHNA